MKICLIMEKLESEMTLRLGDLKLQMWIQGLANEKKGNFVTNAMKRVAAGAHLPAPWLFEPAKRPGDRAD